MRAVGMVLRAQLRQHGKSWLALAMLAALVGGLVMAATATARATAAAFPGFVARYGYDDVVYTARPLPQLARIRKSPRSHRSGRRGSPGSAAPRVRPSTPAGRPMRSSSPRPT